MDTVVIPDHFRLQSCIASKLQSALFYEFDTTAQWGKIPLFDTYHNTIKKDVRQELEFYEPKNNCFLKNSRQKIIVF